jgi:poly(A) polymerase
MISAAGRTGDDATNPRALAYWITPTHAVDRLLLGGGDATALLGWTPPIFPLTGGAIVARGVHAGPAVARLLHAVERQWVAQGFPDKARAEAIADAVVAAA